MVFELEGCMLVVSLGRTVLMTDPFADLDQLDAALEFAATGGP
jgi:hypothetical protein